MNTITYDSQEERRLWRLFPDLIQARQLLLDLFWKDLRVMYRYAALGFLWAIIEPLAFTLILTFVFSFVFAGRGALAQITEGPPFALMLLCGLIFWQYFSTSLTTATTSMITNRNLVKKVRFAREVIPIASCCMPLVNVGIGFVLLIVIHLLFGGRIGFSLFYMLFVFSVQFLLTLGLALILACVHVHFRDVGSVIGVVLLFAFYASPVFYPIEMVRNANIPQWVVVSYAANPMAGLLTCYRQILFEMRFPDIALLIWPILCAVAAFIAGALLFRYHAPTMSDHL